LSDLKSSGIPWNSGPFARMIYGPLHCTYLIQSKTYSTKVIL
jgi:hypothetical protein